MVKEDFNTLSFDLTDGIGHIVINQPPSNMMTVEFFLELGLLVLLRGTVG
jgi:enoyl-CoA hydratase/carnithine racemase